VGILCFSLGITGKIAGSFMIANALFNIYVLCRHPEFAKYRPTTAEEVSRTYLFGRGSRCKTKSNDAPLVQEAAAYLQRNPQMAQRAANAAVDAARRNPETAKQIAGNTWV
jgi:hypothetical protein